MKIILKISYALFRAVLFAVLISLFTSWVLHKVDSTMILPNLDRKGILIIFWSVFLFLVLFFSSNFPMPKNSSEIKEQLVVIRDSLTKHLFTDFFAAFFIGGFMGICSSLVVAMIIMILGEMGLFNENFVGTGLVVWSWSPGIVCAYFLNNFFRKEENKIYPD